MSTKRLPTNDLWEVSSELKTLNDILADRHASVQFYVGGASVTAKLDERAKGLLEVIRTDYVRRRAAPYLERLQDHGIIVDVDFDWKTYLPKDEADDLDA